MNLEQITHFLGWCAIINICILAISTLFLVAATGPIANLQAKLFGISTEQSKISAYNYLANYKIAVLAFNITPYLALRMVAS